MKLMTLFLATGLAFPAFGARKICRPRHDSPGQYTFCRNLSPEICRAHREVCRLVTIPDYGGSCTARPGYEAHERTCQRLNEISCEAHRDICEWLEDWY